MLGADEAPAELEVGLEESLVALDDPLGLRVARFAEDPAHRPGAAEGGELLRRPPAAGAQGALAVPDELLRQGAEEGEAAGDPPDQVGGLIGEDERRGGGPRPPQGAITAAAPGDLVDRQPSTLCIA
jgi:hypothetical protein